MEVLLSMTDEELVVSYAEGNNCAFEILLSRHKQSLFSYILYRVRNRDLADDIFQDTFIKAILTIKQGRYTENGKFRAWITRIAHNLIVDCFRQERNENTVSNDEYEFDLFNNFRLCEDNIEVTMVKAQVFDDVRRLVEYLPDTQREVLNMRYYQELSFKEIADKTGVSINTALGRMRYAILNMRKIADDNRMILSMS
ncbi:MAG: sigma-70 family RNA polymerase sigma factor [Petrimonas sp.]|jgi:RNA polymerase sigma-70 factor (ECF subfamily)|nr:sigma-70 family RNA polymerase sigma factor [Petrimonas sp.]NLU30683.1 sigma-70 family RNA polymerase sigma factor [Bacteroidales bacterium]HAC74154.1 RNA polymerase subunit sigma-24 [Porphyromonadaceae bacterium]MDD2910896.1 sigma-70 family RNA polymerase sigma factor [Petrimonas sp.]MDD3541194.1 sigma-70 family RNA polymerase sigma factor [Petrimonas sp.]